MKPRMRRSPHQPFTSLSTVRKWEVGDKKPGGPSLKLLNLIERKGLEAVI